MLIEHRPTNDVNHYEITHTIDSLPPAVMSIHADGRQLGAFDEAQLGSGVQLATTRPSVLAPGGPWDAQASAASAIIRSRGLARL